LPEAYFELPWPISVNKMYVNAQKSETMARGRYLTNEARRYKRAAISLIYYSCLRIKYGTQDVEVKIIQFPPDRRARDRDNGLKIVFDAIQESGIIENDSQIVAFEVAFGHITKNPHWKIWMRPYQRNKQFSSFQNVLDAITD